MKGKSQKYKRIFEIYKKDDIALLKRFNKELDVLSETHHAQSIQSSAGRFIDL